MFVLENKTWKHSLHRDDQEVRVFTELKSNDDLLEVVFSNSEALLKWDINI